MLGTLQSHSHWEPLEGDKYFGEEFLLFHVVLLSVMGLTRLLLVCWLSFFFFFLFFFSIDTNLLSSFREVSLMFLWTCHMLMWGQLTLGLKYHFLLWDWYLGPEVPMPSSSEDQVWSVLGHLGFPARVFRLCCELWDSIYLWATQKDSSGLLPGSPVSVTHVPVSGTRNTGT